jgi:hypothetical protein
VSSNDGDDEKVDDSGEVYVVAAECDFMRQTQQPKDHFKKHVKETCLNYSYSVKHKLEDCTMMKNFMMSGAFSRGRKPERDPGRKGMTPIPGKAEVMTIFARPVWAPGHYVTSYVLGPQLAAVGDPGEACQANWDPHTT